MSTIYTMSDNNKNKIISKLLNDEFLEWERKQGLKKDITEFGKYLNIDESSLSRYMSGERIPNKITAYIISKRLGPKILDILEYQITKEIKQAAEYKEFYDLTPPKDKDELVDWVEQDLQEIHQSVSPADKLFFMLHHVLRSIRDPL